MCPHMLPPSPYLLPYPVLLLPLLWGPLGFASIVIAALGVSALVVRSRGMPL